MSDTLIIRGFVGNDPQATTTAGGTAVLNFRVATSQRRFDQRTNEWIDTGTNWYSVAAYRQLAEHAKSSLRKGDAVIVSGRLKLREWESVNGHKGASFDLDADAIGHDMRWGTSNFMKTPRSVTASNQPPRNSGSDGAGDERPEPPEPSDAYDDTDAPETDPWMQDLVDGKTGEVRETVSSDAA